MDEANDDINDAIGLLLRAAGSLDIARTDKWENLGLTVPQLRVLVFLRHRPGAAAGAIAQHLGVSPSTVTGIVDRLARIDLVLRMQDTMDRRVVRARLTEAGASAVAGLDEAGRERLMAKLRTLDSGRLQELRRALQGLIQASDEAEPDPSGGELAG